MSDQEKLFNLLYRHVPVARERVPNSMSIECTCGYLDGEMGSGPIGWYNHLSWAIHDEGFLPPQHREDYENRINSYADAIYGVRTLADDWSKMTDEYEEKWRSKRTSPDEKVFLPVLIEELRSIIDDMRSETAIAP